MTNNKTTSLALIICLLLGTTAAAATAKKARSTIFSISTSMNWVFESTDVQTQIVLDYNENAPDSFLGGALPSLILSCRALSDISAAEAPRFRLLLGYMGNAFASQERQIAARMDRISSGRGSITFKSAEGTTIASIAFVGAESAGLSPALLSQIKRARSIQLNTNRIRGTIGTRGLADGIDALSNAGCR